MTALAFRDDEPDPGSLLATNDNELPRLAGFALGYESGSPIGGALSGGLGGFAMGGPFAPAFAAVDVVGGMMVAAEQSTYKC